jgi:hypothetical protein
VFRHKDTRNFRCVNNQFLTTNLCVNDQFLTTNLCVNDQFLTTNLCVNNQFLTTNLCVNNQFLTTNLLDIISKYEKRLLQYFQNVAFQVAFYSK